MAYEMKPNTGSLFRNEKRENEKQPEYTGTALINGKEMRISAWIKESKNGKKFFSIAFSEPYQPKAESAPAKPQVEESLEPQQEDLPF